MHKASLFNRVLFQFRIKRHLCFANKNLFFKFFVAFDNSLNFNDARHWMQTHTHSHWNRLFAGFFFAFSHIKNIYLKFIVPKSIRMNKSDGNREWASEFILFACTTKRRCIFNEFSLDSYEKIPRTDPHTHTHLHIFRMFVLSGAKAALIKMISISNKSVSTNANGKRETSITHAYQHRQFELIRGRN